MAQRRSNQPRKLPSKANAAKVQAQTNDEVVGDAPQENASDVPAGTNENTDTDTQPSVVEQVASESEHESIDPDSDVEAPHMDAKLDEAPKVQTYTDDLPNNEFRKSWKQVLEESGVVPPQGRILFPDEPITYEGFEVEGEKVILTKDIYRMVLPFRSTRPTFTLLARAGRSVPKGQLLSKSAYEKAVRKLDGPEDE